MRKVYSAAYVLSQSYRRKVKHPDSQRTPRSKQRSRTYRAIRKFLSNLQRTSASNL